MPTLQVYAPYFLETVRRGAAPLDLNAFVQRAFASGANDILYRYLGYANDALQGGGLPVDLNEFVNTFNNIFRVRFGGYVSV